MSGRSVVLAGSSQGSVGRMPSTGASPKAGLVKRSLRIGGHRTSLALEGPMWDALEDVGRREKMTVSALCTWIEGIKGKESSLTSAIRVFLLEYALAAATDDGHAAAGHGRLAQEIKRHRGASVRGTAGKG